MAVGGITFFVFLPLPGSGCVTGTLIGQLAGLSRVAGFLAVGIGAGVAAAVYAGVARFLGEQWTAMLHSRSPWSRASRAWSSSAGSRGATSSGC